MARVFAALLRQVSIKIPMAKAKNKLLTIRAGESARLVLREQGFVPDMFSTMVGASGGPKWLVLSQLDRVLVEDFLGPRTAPLDLVGSSIGSFRHIGLAQSDPVAAIERFEEAYIGQVYEARPTGTDVSRESERILDILLGEKGANEVVTHAQFRNHIIAARLRGLLARGEAGLGLALGIAAIGNLATRRALGWMFDRAHFVSSELKASPGPGIRFGDYTTHSIALTEENLVGAVLASGTIPFVMKGVQSISGAPKGLYFDGGLLDYHFDFEFETRPGLIMYPHFFSDVTPGWLDKSLAWRRVGAKQLDRVLLISPSKAFIETLPGARVPDRNDFETQSTKERQRNWNRVVDACRALADELHELIATGSLADAIEPF